MHGTNDKKFTRASNCTKQWYTPGFLKVCDVGSAGNDISAEFKNSNKDMDTKRNCNYANHCQLYQSLRTMKKQNG